MPTSSFVTITDGWPSIEIGRMIHRVTINQYGPTSPPSFDAAGPIQKWTEFAQVWAAISPISGKDVIKGGQTTSQLFLSLAMWFMPGLQERMQIYNQTTGTTYSIESIENVLERNVVLEVNCLALGPQAA